MSTLLLVRDHRVSLATVIKPYPVYPTVNRGITAVAIATNIILAIRIYALYGHNRQGDRYIKYTRPCFSTTDFSWSVRISAGAMYYSSIYSKYLLNCVIFSRIWGRWFLACLKMAQSLVTPRLISVHYAQLVQRL